MDISIVDIAKAARERIKEPEHWTQGCDARDSKGLDVDHSAAGDAACWCISGAVSWAFWHFYDKLQDESSGVPIIPISSQLAPLRDRIFKMNDVISRAAGFSGAVHFNDDERTTHADALAHMDTLVAMLEKEPA